MLLCCLAFVLGACRHYDIPGMLFPMSAGVARRFEHSMAYNASVAERMIELSEDEYVINMAGDIHMEEHSARLDSFLSITRNNPLTACNFFLGDLVEVKGAYIHVMKALQSHYQQDGDTVFVLAGNHDLFFRQWESFVNCFGSSTYTVSVKTPLAQDLIVCLETASGTLGRLQSEWLADVLENLRSGYRHCMVMMHTNLFDTDNSQFPSGNLPLTETCQLTDLFQRYDVDVCVQAHDHFVENILFKEVQYVVVPPLKMETEPYGYLRMKVSGESLKTEIVEGLPQAG